MTVLPPGFSVTESVGLNDEAVIRLDGLTATGERVSIVLPARQMRMVLLEGLVCCDRAERDHLMLGPCG